MCYQTRMPLILLILFRHRAMFLTCPNKESRKSKIGPRQNKLGKYTLLLVKISGLTRWCRLQMRYRLQITTDNRQQTTDRIPKLPTHRHFLFLSRTSLYMVHLSIGHFFLKVAKKVGTQGYFQFTVCVCMYCVCVITSNVTIPTQLLPIARSTTRMSSRAE